MSLHTLTHPGCGCVSTTHTKMVDVPADVFYRSFFEFLDFAKIFDNGIGDNEEIGSVLQDESQSDKGGSDHRYKVVQQLLEQLFVEKLMKSGLVLEDIPGLNEFKDSFYELPIAMEEGRDLINFEAELQTETPLLLFRKGEEFSIDIYESGQSLQNLTNSALPMFNKFSRKELVTREKKFFPIQETADTELSIEKLPEQTGSDVYDKFIGRFLLTKETADMELSIEKLPEQTVSDVYDKFSRREPVSSNVTRFFPNKKTADTKLSIDKISEQTAMTVVTSNNFSRREPTVSDNVIRFLLNKKIADTKLSIDKFSEQTAMTVTSDKFSRREPVSGNVNRFLVTEGTTDMELLIEKLREEMGVTVDHEKLKLFTKQMQDHPQYMYKRFLYQKVVQQLSKTDGKLDLVELLPKQPHELKQFPTISPFDQNKMLTDGHQDSEHIVLLFGMLISLAPAIILLQQSEIVLSYVKMNDILLSLLDQFSEVCCVQYTV